LRPGWSGSKALAPDLLDGSEPLDSGGYGSKDPDDTTSDEEDSRPVKREGASKAKLAPTVRLMKDVSSLSCRNRWRSQSSSAMTNNGRRGDP
jgi:hypothetical protein